MDGDTNASIDIALLPELDTVVGMSGATIEVEVGGQICLASVMQALPSL